ncbi:MAG TPA: adenosylcobinamide-phosphate synthase CbiB [Puia sp.]|nr:adenosylcobinamide-phosphate synthase CbiB [Puia sp.]
MRLIIPLTAGYLLDLWLGDPAGWPHPIRLFGWLIAKGEAWLNRGSARFWKGALLTLLLSAATLVFFHYLLILSYHLHPIVYYLVSSLFVFYGLAHRQLIKESRQVFDTLQQEGLEAGRRQLSRIVGRDTRALSPGKIRIAVMETLSENLSDGVIAPLFYYACAGVPGMMMYKMINTLDSMIGYRTDRYELFGKFAARLDDVTNFIPARLTAFLMAVVACNIKAFQFIIRYGHRHKSPNAGYPEAALAGILDVQFGGTNIYHGVAVTKPFIGSNPRELSSEEIEKAININHRVCLSMVVLIIITGLCLNIS